MKLVGWMVKYRAAPQYRRDRRDAWHNSRRMSWSLARQLVGTLQGAGYETRVIEIPLERWVRMPLHKKVGCES